MTPPAKRKFIGWVPLAPRLTMRVMVDGELEANMSWEIFHDGRLGGREDRKAPRRRRISLIELVSPHPGSSRPCLGHTSFFLPIVGVPHEQEGEENTNELIVTPVSPLYVGCAQSHRRREGDPHSTTGLSWSASRPTRRRTLFLQRFCPLRLARRSGGSGGQGFCSVFRSKGLQFKRDRHGKVNDIA